jgi:hypothetical protein
MDSRRELLVACCGWLLKAGGGGASRWGNEIEHIGQKFTSFGGVMKLGFGVGTAKALLSELHHGLMEFGEATSEAHKHGLGFFDSLAEGARKLVGYKTIAEEAAEATKKLETAQESFEKAMEKLHPNSDRFHNLPGESGKLDELGAARNQFRDAYSVAFIAAQKFRDNSELLTPHGEVQKTEAEKREREAKGKMDTANAIFEAERQRLAAANEDAKYQYAITAFDREQADILADREETEKENMQMIDDRNKWLEKQAELAQQQADEDGKQLKEGMDMRDSIRAARLSAKNALENPQTSGSISGVEDVFRQIQQAALGGTNDPTTGTEQKKQTEIFNDVKAAVEQNKPLIYGAVA